ncbi:MAG: TlpA family protein disulfide reductase [Chitinophagaceae bacterium]|nr:TlpA family protein disulfide reductase [Chitinophagaceae bacterium]
MKQYSLIILIFMSLNSYGQISLTPKPRVYESVIKIQNGATGKPFPSFTTYYQDKVFSNQNLKGKTVFINFWFASCPPCISEFDGLNELYDSLKGNKDFEFISFTFETPEKIKEITEKYKIQYKIFSIKKEECYRLNQNMGFPTNIIIDPNGIIKLLRTGGPLESGKVKNIIFTEFTQPC